MKNLKHIWHLWKFGKTKCTKCGLIYLNNKATEKAVKAPCPGTPEE